MTEIGGLPVRSLLILCGELLGAMAEGLWTDTFEDWGICWKIPPVDREALAAEFNKWQNQDADGSWPSNIPFEEISITSWMCFFSRRIEEALMPQNPEEQEK